ncbi:HTH domain-containing protein [Anaerorhabdus sp.]|uniref:HTH domain-containing protein n=1 Tax=Anaerorhabdus sp. TaxID=1872524 RepID=UPI002FC90CA9
MKNILLELVENDKISIESLARISKSNDIEVKNYLDDKYEINQDNLQAISFLNQFGVFIEEGFKVDADSRIKAIIEVMMLDYKLSLEQISLLINTDIKIVEEILYSPHNLSAESKYEVAIKLYFLFYIMK